MHYRVRAFFRGMMWGFGVLGCVAIYGLILTLIGQAVYESTASPPLVVGVVLFCLVPTIFGIINALEARR